MGTPYIIGDHNVLIVISYSIFPHSDNVMDQPTTTAIYTVISMTILSIPYKLWGV